MKSPSWGINYDLYRRTNISNAVRIVKQLLRMIVQTCFADRYRYAAVTQYCHDTRLEYIDGIILQLTIKPYHL